MPTRLKDLTFRNVRPLTNIDSELFFLWKSEQDFLIEALNLTRFYGPYCRIWWKSCGPGYGDIALRKLVRWLSIKLYGDVESRVIFCLNSASHFSSR